MFLDLFPSHHKHEVVPLLTLHAGLYDGSEITALAENRMLTFATAMGPTRIGLRQIASMKNISHVVALRRYLWANKFEIEFRDGCRLIGTPRHPRALPLYDNGAPHARGRLQLWEIDWLRIETDGALA
ncbi:MAG: hypothetical protein ONB48_18260 [candidate division KSB1 bacterium]|nr:hypothetical protein [candidate division KSB1 bacterium]MDZ7275839.1 hypothetical protein [candidate division KSB1 bacterium]MDZ7287589.1 hypothetical protein [candidate division KSB1 bacterium]MDZ7306507.1 hypothetical protein [candidate division KSB1 bacterium]MDZ7350567.1 hypothetical protein [candidate division KSB1 bacterium]